MKRKNDRLTRREIVSYVLLVMVTLILCALIAGLMVALWSLTAVPV